MNIVIPMAGRGSRFAQQGIQTPKPLIQVRGYPMYAWAVESLPLHLAEHLIFICLREHLEHTPLAEDIQNRYGRRNPLVIELSGVTEGQASTVLMAKRQIDNLAPLTIFNADTFCRSDLDKRLSGGGQDVDGYVGVFQAQGERWSFARTDPQGRVIEMAEKRRISPWACTGLYYFARGADFVRSAEAMIAAGERVNHEFYVAPVYNRMIAEGKNIRLDVAREAWAIGTPEDLSHFEDHCPYRNPAAVLSPS